MAQAKKKTATKTKKSTAQRKTGSRANSRTAKKQQEQKSNMFFVVSMSVLAASLLFANLLMMTT